MRLFCIPWDLRIRLLYLSNNVPFSGGAVLPLTVEAAALQAGRLKCLPRPLVVGKRLEAVQITIEKCEAGVSTQRSVVEL